MNCKNCNHNLPQNAHFCENCGAQVILKRITFKQLFIDFIINFFGIDSRFFVTLRKMAVQPHEVISEYLEGVRKRYINPFAFLAIAAGISLVVFNYFADDFIQILESVQSEQLDELKEKANFDLSQTKGLSKEKIEKLKVEKKIAQFQLDFNSGMWEFMLKYFNLLTFVFLLLYALLSKWTFWKPHNYGEHIVINAYAYGFTTYLTLLVFFLALLIHPSIYMYSIPISIIYYLFVFGKFYKLSFWKNLQKLIRFLFGLILVIIIFGILAFVIGIAIAFFGLINL